MSQTLTKPILLDETGQAIAGKLDTNSAAIVDALDDIKDAIGTSAEFIPVMIKVVTPPTKTSYRTGEPLNLSGLVVNLVGTNGVQIDVTSACTFVPANGTPLTANDTSVAVSYYYAAGDLTFNTTLAVGVKDLSSISITTPPTKTAYKAGETLDLTGMVVMATYSDTTTLDVTSRCTFSPADGATLTTSDTTITATYLEGGVTKTATQSISVKELSSIVVTTPPTTTSYADGDELDLTGIVVTATYSDTTTEDVTLRCTYNPSDGTVLSSSDTSVSITFTEGGTTKTTSQAITVAYPIYGVEWDGTSTTAWTRTDAAANFTDPVPYYSGMTGDASSPFDNIFPWSDMEVVDDATAGKLVKIPKFYFKRTVDSSTGKIKIQISGSPFDGSMVSPAHMDRSGGSNDYDNIYVARYHCDSNYKSTSGGAPKSGERWYTYRTQIHSLGNDYYMYDFMTLQTIQLLYLVEFADWNSQEKIGYGGYGNSQTNGQTDLMPYHTGTMETSRQSYGAIQYRNIEGLWSGKSDWINGLYVEYMSYQYKYNISKILSGADYDDYEYTDTGILPTLNDNSNSFVKKWSSPTAIGFEWGMLPYQQGGLNPSSYNQYDCDQLYFYNSSNVAYYCGAGISPSNYDGQGTGLFCMNFLETTTEDSKVSSRLIKLPS